jgi:hypothetical protein
VDMRRVVIISIVWLGATADSKRVPKKAYWKTNPRQP